MTEDKQLPMFRSYDIYYHENPLSRELRVWCLDEQSNPTLIRVVGLTMNVTCMLPEIANWGLASIRNLYLNSLRARLRNKDIKFSHVAIYRTTPLCYHDPRKASEMHQYGSYAVVILTSTKQDFRKIQNMMRYPTSITYNRKRCSIKTSKCDPRINIEWMILCGLGENGLGYCQWFRSKAYYAPVNPISRVNEMMVYAKDIVPIDSDKRTFPMTMSFDGEMYSDNPKAFPKGYKPKDKAYLLTASFKRIESDEPMKRVAILFGKCDQDVALSARDERVNTQDNSQDAEDTKLDATIIEVETEVQMIREFEKLIMKVNPVIITGYNTIGFDWKYLDERMGVHNINWSNFSLMKMYDVSMSSVSWGSSAYGDVNLIFPDCPGRISIDVMSHVKRNYKFPRYTLNYVSEKFLGDKKLDVSAREMFAAVSAQDNNEPGHLQKLARVVKYGIIDADLPLRLFEHFKMWTASTEMCNVVNVTPNMLLKSGQQKRVAALLFKECKMSQMTMNYKVVGAQGYTGGFVGKPIKGIHNHVIVLDFKSLYPSLMYMFNLCYSTYVPPELVQYIKQEDRKHYHFITIKKIEGEDDDKDDKDDNKDETETHVFYRGKMGVIPSIVSKLLTARGKVKKEMKKHPKGSGIYGVLDARQKAYKVSCNSIYGFLGVSEEKGILPLLPIAKSTTFLGRDAILKTNRYIMEKWPGTQVVYNDTDSTMFTIDMSVPGSPQFEPTPENYERFGEEVGKIVSNYLRVHYLGEEEAKRRGDQLGMLDLEFEEMVRKMLCIEKKMYVKAYSPKDDPDNINFETMSYKGIMLARRNACNFTRNIYRTILMMIMKGCPSNDIMNTMVDFMILCRSRSIKMCDLLENQGVGGGYKNKTYFMSMFVDNLALDGKSVGSGERLDYILLKSVDGKEIKRDNGKVYKGDRMRLMEQINDLLREETPFKLDTTYYSEAGIDNIDKLFSIAFGKQIEEGNERARQRIERQYYGNEKRVGILKKAGYPDFRIRNSSYFVRINSCPLKNMNKLAALKDKWIEEIKVFDIRCLRRVLVVVKREIVVIA